MLEHWIAEDNPVRVIDVFVDELDLGELGVALLWLRQGCVQKNEEPDCRVDSNSDRHRPVC